jgi:hypothetical protein
LKKIWNIVLTIALFVVVSGCDVVFGQEQQDTPTETTVISRAAFGPDRSGYKLLEVYQTRKDGWIFPDVGYIDFRTARTYREFFIGGGKVLQASKKSLLIGELYVVQATGPAAKGATYLQPWVLAQYKPTNKTTLEGVYFPYIRLNKNAVTQHVLERVKMEKDFGSFKAGAGYSAYKFGQDKWQHKPFVSVTMKTQRLGNFEVWGQKVPTGFQIQVRHDITFR